MAINAFARSSCLRRVCILLVLGCAADDRVNAATKGDAINPPLAIAQMGAGLGIKLHGLTRLNSPIRQLPLRDAAKSIQRNVKQAVELPVEISAVDKHSDSLVKLRARVFEGTGLLMDPSRRIFVDQVYVMLVDRDDPAKKITLREPVEVMLEAVGATAEPRPIKLLNTVTPIVVTIAVPEPTGKTFPVTVRASLEDVGDTLHLQVVPPRVSVRPEHSSIIGWGIGTTRVHLESPWLRRDRGYDVIVTSDTGGLSPSGRVRLDAEGLGEVILRSDRTAGTRVWTGQAESIEAASVTFRPPWIFLSMAALGGLAGAFLRKKGRRSWPRALSIGIVTGMAAAILYAAGLAPKLVELAGAQELAANGEALVAGIGLLAALGGVSLFIPNLPVKARS